jgi:hypothetical protein
MCNRCTKTFLTILLALSLIVSAPLISLAHSGRTDSNGGHKDNKNVSGLGSYHYHCGGNPAHLHTNGICPYKNVPQTVTTPAPAPSPTSTSVPSSDVKVTTINLIIDGNTVRFTESTGFPFTDSANRTQVPLRKAMEAFGCQVSWDQDSKIALVEKDGVTVTVPLGYSYILKNDVPIATDTTSIMNNSKVYLPIRPVLEAFGARVSWDNMSRSVIITSTSDNL